MSDIILLKGFNFFETRNLGILIVWVLPAIIAFLTTIKTRRLRYLIVGLLWLAANYSFWFLMRLGIAIT